MPLKSKSQERALWAKDPKVAQHFENATSKKQRAKLPEKLAFGGSPMKDNKKTAALILGIGKPTEPEGEEELGNSEGLDSACAELLSAIEAKDATAVGSALKNAFAILDSEPHEEGAHTDEGSEE